MRLPILLLCFGFLAPTPAAKAGDLLGIAGEYELTSPVEGKALIAGGNVRVAKRVASDLFAAGGNVVIAAMLFGLGAIVMSIVRPVPPAAAA